MPSSLAILGGRVDLVTRAQALESVQTYVSSGRFLQIITANTLMLLDSEKDAELQSIFKHAGLVTADGVGVSLAAWIKGYSIPERIPGIDLITDLCAIAQDKHWPVYFLGANPGIAERAKNVLLKRFPKLPVSGVSDGYFSEDQEPELIKRIRDTGTKILFVGMNAPHQEKWIAKHQTKWPGMCAMGVGGSFDVLSGDLKRAPHWMQSAGLEWLFRLVQQPWRWKRMARLPLLIFKVLHRTHI